jgi:hypothetical protein
MHTNSLLLTASCLLNEALFEAEKNCKPPKQTSEEGWLNKQWLMVGREFVSI